MDSFLLVQLHYTMRQKKRKLREILFYLFVTITILFIISFLFFIINYRKDPPRAEFSEFVVFDDTIGSIYVSLTISDNAGLIYSLITSNDIICEGFDGCVIVNQRIRGNGKREVYDIYISKIKGEEGNKKIILKENVIIDIHGNKNLICASKKFSFINNRVFDSFGRPTVWIIGIKPYMTIKRSEQLLLNVVLYHSKSIGSKELSLDDIKLNGFRADIKIDKENYELYEKRYLITITNLVDTIGDNFITVLPGSAVSSDDLTSLATTTKAPFYIK